MLGYYNDPEETAKILEDDGWIHTGDLGMLSKDKKMLKICGRSKNVIVLKNGKNVYPEEIEAKINKLIGIKESIVFDKSYLTRKSNCNNLEIISENQL